MTVEKGYWTGFSQRRLGRRSLLRGAAKGSAGLAAAAIIGCGEQKEPSAPATAPASKEPKRGGVLTHAADINRLFFGLRGFDPHVLIAPFGQYSGAIYQTLLRYSLAVYGGQEFKVEPEIAQSWQQPSQTEYVFTLQPNVKWHNRPPADGRVLTGEDVVFSLDRARTAEPRFIHRSHLANVDKIQAVDKSTVKITTKRPDAVLLTKLSADPVKILAPEAIERFGGRLQTAEQVIGTGAFMLRSSEDNVGADLVRNPDYWKPSLPYLDGIRLPNFVDPQTTYAAFVAGRAEIVHFVPGPEVKNYIAAQGRDYSPVWTGTVHYEGLPYTNTKAKPFNDARLWKALRLLLDHQALVRSWQEPTGGRGQYGSIFTGAVDSWDLTHDEYGRLLEWKQPKDEAARTAIEFLNAAGFNRANPLKFEVLALSQFGFDTILAPLVQARWRELSGGVVEGTIKPADLPVQAARRVRGEFEFIISGANPGLPEPDAALVQMYRTGGGLNYAGFSDPRLDALIDRQSQTSDSAQRKAIIREIILYAVENTPFTSFDKAYRLHGVKPHVRGHSPEGNPTLRQYEQIWFDT